MSAVASGFAFQPNFGGRRPYRASAMAARCGDDVVRLQPAWPALIAATRFARRARWLFGNRAATLECVEPQTKRWLTQRGPDDPVQVRFDFGSWASAYARCDGRAREIDVFAADGSIIAAVRLDEADATLDELLWLLVDDDQRRGAAGVRREHVHECTYNRAGALAPGALHAALLAACDTGLPLRLTLANAGGSVTWAPRNPLVYESGNAVELRSALGSVMLGDRYSREWTVRLSGAEREPQLEARGSDDAPWLTIALIETTALQRIAWRGICAALPAH